MQHGDSRTLQPISGGTGSISGTCNDGAWTNVVKTCVAANKSCTYAGETTVEQNSDISIEETRKPAFLWDKGASLSDIVNAINKLNVSPGDLVAILEALSQAGALSAELVVI